jgi:hypothetical protein
MSDGRCDECGANLVDNCPVCGAPICCPQCCRIDQQTARIKKLNDQVAYWQKATLTWNELYELDARENGNLRDNLANLCRQIVELTPVAANSPAIPNIAWNGRATRYGTGWP